MQKKGLSVGDAIALAAIWLCAFGSIALVTTQYHGDQQVSLENAIGYIVIGAVLVTILVLLRDALLELLRSLID